MYEFEKKLLLTEEEYQVLLMYFGRDLSTEKQINYYFDTDDYSMNQKGITCRIRYKNGKYRATMKSHQVLSDDCSIESDSDVQNGLEKNCFTDMGLTLQGSLTTERTVVLKNASYEMILDRNRYLGEIDYELEIEYPDGGQHQATQLMEKVCEILLKNCRTTTIRSIRERMKQNRCKSRRFFEKKQAGSSCSRQN